MFVCIQARLADDKNDLLAIDDNSINNSFFTEVRITINELNNELSKAENVLSTIKNILAAGEDSDAYKDRQRIMAR